MRCLYLGKDGGAIPTLALQPMTSIDKGGRPTKQVDQRTFEALCNILCTKDEICGILDLDEKTLTRWCKDTYDMGFSDIYKKLSATGKMSLRRSQFELAKKSAAMAIFLGKNYLGQRDHYEVDNSEALGKLDQILSGIDKQAND